jgi:hypothetical protein
MQLSHPLETSAIVTCDSCKRGFTAGIAVKSKGTLAGRAPAPDDAPAPSDGFLLTRYQCVQITHTFEYGSGKNEVGQHPLTLDHSRWLPEPQIGTAHIEHACPSCGTKLTFQLRSLEAADQSAASTQRLANVAVWSLLALPFAALFFAVRYLLGTYAGDAVPPLDVGIGVGAVALALVGLVSLYLRSSAYRQQALLPTSRATMSASPLSQPLWRTTSMYTKGARLEVTHKLLAVETPATGGTDGSPTIAERKQKEE